MALLLGTAGLAFHAHDNLFGFQGRKIASFVRRCDRVRNGTGPCCCSCTRRMPRIGTDRDVGRFHRNGCRTLLRECWWFGTRKWHDHRVGKWLSVHQRLVWRRKRSQHAVQSCKRRSSRSYRQCVTHGRIPHDSRSVHLRERRGMQSKPKQYLRMKNSSLNGKLPQTSAPSTHNISLWYLLFSRGNFTSNWTANGQTAFSLRLFEGIRYLIKIFKPC